MCHNSTHPSTCRAHIGLQVEQLWQNYQSHSNKGRWFPNLVPSNASRRKRHLKSIRPPERLSKLTTFRIPQRNLRRSNFPFRHNLKASNRLPSALRPKLKIQLTRWETLNSTRLSNLDALSRKVVWLSPTQLTPTMDCFVIIMRIAFLSYWVSLSQLIKRYWSGQNAHTLACTMDMVELKQRTFCETICTTTYIT